jgi:sugar lactone lactonase YvrE
MLTVMAGRLMRVQGNVMASDEPLLTGGRISAITTAPDGQLWAASSDDVASSIGPLGEDGTWEPLWTINAQIGALVWDQDAQHLYAADPSRGVIYVLQRSARTPRILTRIPRVSGEPRGLATDPHGRLWTVLYDGWSIARLSIEGEFDRVTALPVPRPTGITFGGPDGQSVFITTARVGLARDVLDKASLSGRLLVIRSKGPALNKSENKPQRRTGSRKVRA